MRHAVFEHQKFLQCHMWLVQILIVALFCVFSLRLWYLQIYKGGHFAQKAQENRIRRHRVYAPRGLISDVRGRFLAVNEPAYALALIRENCSDVPRVLRHVAHFSGVDIKILHEVYEKGRSRVRPFEKQVILSDISFELLARIEAEAARWPELYIVVQPRRHYIEGPVFSHVLGYVAQANEDDLNSDPTLQLGDTVGKNGLEYMLESRLRGGKGLKEEEVDAVGRCLNERILVPSEAGESLRLSIDMDLQQVAARQLQGQAGAIVVLDPQECRILALVSQPGYDNNFFVSGLSKPQWNALVDDSMHPLQNRAIQSAYPPGSVFKLVMAACGLSNKAISPRDRVFCGGSFKLGRREFRCWKKYGHGHVDLRKSLVESCDVYYYQLGKNLGIDEISMYAKACGFGAPTGIDLPSEQPGLVPDRDWKKRRFGESWQGGDTINLSIGQGMLLTTPIQVARYVAALLNGGYIMRPLLLADGAPKILGTLPMDSETRELITEAMVETVESRHGTAWRLKRPGVEVGGKTGTAQVIKLMDKYKEKDTDEIPYMFRDHAWLASFARVGEKAYVVVAMIEHGGHGGSACGPVINAVYEFLFPEAVTQGEALSKEEAA